MTATHNSLWAQFDETLEMAQFNAIQAKFTAAGENAVNIADIQHELGNLNNYAWSTGYADADSHLCDSIGRSPDAPYTIAQNELFEAYERGEYWTSIAESEKILQDSTPNPLSKAMASVIGNELRLSYREGRIERMLKVEVASAD